MTIIYRRLNFFNEHTPYKINCFIDFIDCFRFLKRRLNKTMTVCYMTFYHYGL
jgi:hypothetical protein